jgi:small-conductance mechanosensitive channel
LAKNEFLSFYFLFLVIVGSVWYSGVQSLATYFGLLTAGLAVAFKDILASLIAWFYIIWIEPFKVGQRIQVGSVTGDIIDIGVVQLSLFRNRRTFKY